MEILLAEKGVLEWLGRMRASRSAMECENGSVIWRKKLREKKGDKAKTQGATYATIGKSACSDDECHGGTAFKFDLDASNEGFSIGCALNEVFVDVKCVDVQGVDETGLM
ncbi:hypothetical protein VNO77_41505 [Canavalia gladiata]|uniref:Uncharacterized protein n=1 Tax=Canavalia gladiata TaxID=3824 RepID=A0AAN9K0Y8_CANGL